MKSKFRITCACLVLSVAVHAGATNFGINNESRSRASLLGSVVFLEVGTTNACIICRVQSLPMPMPVKAELGPFTCK